jgi:hypothetical protein
LFHSYKEAQGTENKKKLLKPSMVVHMCNLNYSVGGDRRIMSTRPAKEKIVARTCLKQNKNENAGDFTQVVKYLPGIKKTLGSIL